MTFYVRSHAGLTRKLAAYGRLTPEATSRAWVEGPYGGIPYAVENVFDCMILVSGGGSVTACLPWLEHLAHKHANGQDMRTRAVKFVWVARYTEHLSWIEENLRALEGLASGKGGVLLEKRLFVTNHTQAEASTSNGSIELEENLDDNPTKQDETSAKFVNGRPHMKDLIPQLVALASRNLVIGKCPRILEPCLYGPLTESGCGPESLKIDLSNVCAKIQTRVLEGETEEVALHTETFGW